MTIGHLGADVSEEFYSVLALVSVF
jgi:hypothetical protein